jgi:hypothetical protein
MEKILKNHKSVLTYLHENLSQFIFLFTLLLMITACGGGGGSVEGSGGSSGNASSNSATLIWEAPTTNADGTPRNDLAGFKIYYGTSPGNYTDSIDAGNATTYTFSNLSNGTYYVAVTVYDLNGIESDYSSEVVKVIQ